MMFMVGYNTIICLCNCCCVWDGVDSLESDRGIHFVTEIEIPVECDCYYCCSILDVLFSFIFYSNIVRLLFIMCKTLVIQVRHVLNHVLTF